MGIQHIDDLGEIGERPGKAIDLVNERNLNLASLDIGEEPLQGRALYLVARELSVVVHLGKRDPSGVTLARDVGLTGFALRIERVESCSSHCRTTCGCRSRSGKSRRTSGDQASACSPSALSTERPAHFLKPKKRGPDQWAPVISRATIVRDR